VAHQASSRSLVPDAVTPAAASTGVNLSGPLYPLCLGDEQASSPPVQLAYFDVLNPQAGVFVAGVLVVNQAGLPVAFHYTELLKPTKLQCLLYGEALAPYVRRHLLLEPLLNQIEQPYAHLLLHDERLLNTSGWTPDEPFLRLKATQTSSLGQAFSFRCVGSDEALLQLWADQPPLRLSGLPPLNLAAPLAPDEPHPWQAHLSPLGVAGQALALTEPFDRVTKALAQLLADGALTSCKPG
jgi:hypothetical protein